MLQKSTPILNRNQWFNLLPSSGCNLEVNTMNVVFRADASIEIGTGHIMRCLTLANSLVEKRAKVHFICSETAGNLINYLHNQNRIVHPIPESKSFSKDAKDTINILNKARADLLIIDHYKIDIEWEKVVKDHFPNLKLMVIDDLANRRHFCDVLLDQNYYENLEHRYDQLVPAHCVKLLGPRYLLLRPEFIRAKKYLQQRTGSFQKILIFFGGSDPTNETEKCLLALKQMDISELHIDVVVGSANPNGLRVKELCEELNLCFHCQIDYLADLMVKADLSIGAGGVTMWERMYLGLPSLTVIVAENQRETVEAASNFGAVWNLGCHENVKVANYVDNMREAMNRPHLLERMSIKGMELMQSDGTNQPDWIEKYLL